MARPYGRREAPTGRYQIVTSLLQRRNNGPV